MARLYPNTGATPASPGFYEDTNSNSAYDAGVDYLVNDAGNRLSLADGTTNLYIKATATVRAQNVNPVDFSAPYDYGSEASFKAGVDLSMAGMMRDCAECHVGGGAMEYLSKVPGTNLATTPRIELRDATLSGFNAFNKFIDQYDENGDGQTGEVLSQDYSQTGVLEMDCLMCHLEGFSWEERTAAIRTGKFDASRVTGAGLGTATSGTVVAYDPTTVVVDNNGTAGNPADDRLALSGFVSSRIMGAPPSDNCSSCHMDMHAVDWKKRGDYWGVPYEADVHGAIGCMGCHERNDGQDMTAILGESTVPATWTGAANTALGHDPAKGVAPYSSLWNTNDGTATKNCAGCHKPAPATETYARYGAVDPTAKHEALGLTSLILQSGVAGVKDKSHLDIIECSGCHVRKLGHGPTPAAGSGNHSLYEWGTGGAMVDGTGADEEGRLTDHENLYVERTMENNLALAWQGGKLIKANALNTMFWRDKTDAGVDINADGQAGGMDAVNPSHIRDANTAAGLHALTVDGTVTAAEIEAQRQAMLSYLPTVGINVTGATLKLNFMGVMFKVNHNVNPASTAWGAGGCTDCHGVDKGFYNGPYELQGRDLNFTYAATDTVPLTTVNGTQPTDFHSTLYAKPSQGDNRSIALNIRNGGPAGAYTALRTIDLSEALWEATLRVPIQTTQGGVVTTRAQYVDYLNNRVDAVHSRHVSTGFGKCTNCHDNGSGVIDYNLVSAATGLLDKNGVQATFTYTPDPLGNPGTCSANTCHGSYGFSTTNKAELASEVSVSAQLSALASMDTDLTVELNANRSVCSHTEPAAIAGNPAVTVIDPCTFSWDVNNDGTFGDGAAEGVVGGNGTDTVVVEYSAEGDYQSVVRVTNSVTGETRAKAATAKAIIVEDPVSTAALTMTRPTATTCTVSGTQGNAVHAYIYWGNRKRTTVSNTTTFNAGITATCGANVRVELLDADHNSTSVILN